MSFRYVVESEKSPAEAIAAVESELSSRKFSVLWHLDMSRTLEQKGFPGHHEVHILEVCSAPRANEALNHNPAIAYLLPCKIIVEQHGDGSEIGVLSPQAIFTLLSDPELAPMAAEVESVLREAVDAAR